MAAHVRRGDGTEGQDRPSTLSGDDNRASNSQNHWSISPPFEDRLDPGPVPSSELLISQRQTCRGRNQTSIDQINVMVLHCC